MPRCNVEYNGKWAAFSTVSDGFVTEFMDKENYEIWRKREYGTADYKPAEQCNIMPMKEAVFSASLNRDRNEWLNCILESGLPQFEVEQLMRDCESEYYAPKQNRTGNYECPNCHRTVAKSQERCLEPSCEIKLVWPE